jgi:plastocyanin
MSRPLHLAVAAAVPLIAGQAAAASLDVRVTDTAGRPLENAVVSLKSEMNAPPGEGAALPEHAYIDQKNETFIPLVTILPPGGSITFRNSDKTMHQVYSFSPIKRFEYEIDVGHSSPPVEFDKPGIAAIGCNIHDHMITYVVVTSSPYTKLSDESGHVRFAKLPEGHYTAEVWHPDMAPHRKPPTRALDVAGDEALALAVKILPRMTAPMGHMDSY